jgi:hypothetical protein
MKRLILIFTLIFFCGLSLFNDQTIADSGKFTRQEFYNEYFVLQSEFKWLNFETYKLIKIAAYKYDVPTIFICSVFQYETGDYCKNNWNKMLTVRGKSGEIGPGQIIAKFHLKKGETKRMLSNPKFHINKIASILNDYRKQAGYNWRKTLKNYNSGPFSHYYNEPYINRILTKYHKVSKLVRNIEV